MTERDSWLMIDVGNSLAKWGCYRAGWIAHGQVDTTQLAMLPIPDGVARVVASNVAGPAATQVLEAMCAGASVPLTLLKAEAAECGVTNRYRDPAQLGTDRWAALVATRGLGARPRLVILAGTATTIDALTGAGEFLGGVIMPGLRLMRAALNHGTAQLKVPPGHYADFPRATEDAITTGALAATLGAIERQAALLTRHDASPTLVLSGGAAPQLAAYLSTALVREHLVLEGLLAIATDRFAPN